MSLRSPIFVLLSLLFLAEALPAMADDWPLKRFQKNQVGDMQSHQGRQIQILDSKPSVEKSKAMTPPKITAPYDESADGDKLIGEALAIAKKENKRVLIQFGANWCIWCRRLHELFSKEKTLPMS